MRKAMTFLGLACLFLAGLFYVGFRLTGAADLVPGDDTPFTLLMFVPLALIAGTIFSAIAWMRRDGPDRLAGLALLANGGLLVAIVALAVFGLATYTGR